MSRGSEIKLIELSCTLAFIALAADLSFVCASRLISGSNLFNVCLSWCIGFAGVCALSSACIFAFVLIKTFRRDM